MAKLPENLSQQKIKTLMQQRYPELCSKMITYESKLKMLSIKQDSLRTSIMAMMAVLKKQ
jgi:hypothetical protein